MYCKCVCKLVIWMVRTWDYSLFKLASTPLNSNLHMRLLNIDLSFGDFEKLSASKAFYFIRIKRDFFPVVGRSFQIISALRWILNFWVRLQWQYFHFNAFMSIQHLFACNDMLRRCLSYTRYFCLVTIFKNIKIWKMRLSQQTLFYRNRRSDMKLKYQSIFSFVDQQNFVVFVVEGFFYK